MIVSRLIFFKNRAVYGNFIDAFYMLIISANHLSAKLLVCTSNYALVDL